MKNKNIIQRFCLFIFALVLTMPAGAQGGSGNGNEPFTIASKDDWERFCNRVKGGEAELNAKMTQDTTLRGPSRWWVTRSILTPPPSTDRDIRSLSIGKVVNSFCPHSYLWVMPPSRTYM